MRRPTRVFVHLASLLYGEQALLQAVQDHNRLGRTPAAIDLSSKALTLLLNHPRTVLHMKFQASLRNHYRLSRQRRVSTCCRLSHVEPHQRPQLQERFETITKVAQHPD